MAKNAEPNATTLQVDLADRSYPIHIGRDILHVFGELVTQALPKTRHAVVMFDENVSEFTDQVCMHLTQLGWRITRLKIPSGESSKSVQAAERLWQEMLNDHTDRGSAVIAVGGGVVGDLAGFAAASFARGIPLVQIPTTLLSQVDSSVGGKTAVNLPGAKNIVGAFWQPSLVVIDSATLDTLPKREFVSGLAEVAKYGVILLPTLFDFLESECEAILLKNPAAISHIVRESCRAKAVIVQEDERETTGRRAILNYGHTFAHALESVAGYGKLLHGEAVSIGMHMAALLAQRLGRVSEDFVARQHRLLASLELPTQFYDADPEAMWAVMRRDKKVEHGKLRFVLPSALGSVELVSGLDASEVRAAIEESIRS